MHIRRSPSLPSRPDVAGVVGLLHTLLALNWNTGIKTLPKLIPSWKSKRNWEKRHRYLPFNKNTHVVLVLTFGACVCHTSSLSVSCRFSTRLLRTSFLEVKSWTTSWHAAMTSAHSPRCFTSKQRKPTPAVSSLKEGSARCLAKYLVFWRRDLYCLNFQRWTKLTSNHTYMLLYIIILYYRSTCIMIIYRIYCTK